MVDVENIENGKLLSKINKTETVEYNEQILGSHNEKVCELRVLVVNKKITDSYVRFVTKRITPETLKQVGKILEAIALDIEPQEKEETEIESEETKLV